MSEMLRKCLINNKFKYWDRDIQTAAINFQLARSVNPERFTSLTKENYVCRNRHILISEVLTMTFF